MTTLRLRVVVRKFFAYTLPGALFSLVVQLLGGPGVASLLGFVLLSTTAYFAVEVWGLAPETKARLERSGR